MCLCCHTFLHTNISFLSKQAVPLEAIQDRIDHNKGSKVTDIYPHVNKKN